MKDRSKITHLKGKVNVYIEKILTKPRKEEEAETLAKEFLHIMAQLADEQEQLETKEGFYKGQVEATLAKAFRNLEGSAAAKEKESKDDPEYLDALAERSANESGVSWIKTYLMIFQNSHLIFRQKAERLGKL